MTVIAPFTVGRCPDCDTVLDLVHFDQPAVVRHGGYGATVRTVLRSCPKCGWKLVAERGEVRP